MASDMVHTLRISSPKQIRSACSHKTLQPSLAVTPRALTTPIRLLCLALILLAFNCANAQGVKSSNDIHVLPRPKALKATGDVFKLGNEVRVVLADPRSEEDRFAAQDFLDDVKETAHLSLSLAKGGRRRSILIGSIDLPTVRSALKRFDLDAQLGSAAQNSDPEGYVLGVTPDQVIVAGRTAAGVFYGLQTLKQLVQGEGADAYVPGVWIIDWPTMRWRGVSDDISRGPVPTVEYIKRQLRTEAAFKLNMHSFYMEQTFASASHPLIAPEGGALTPAEIRELAVYARRYHIELVPEQQTFGHLHNALKIEKYNELAETPYGDVLSPQQEGTYKLIGDLYRELNELFPGKFFHIGADETFELGEGQSREAVKQRGVGAVYFEHLRRVSEILKPYNRRLMFWGDIALRHPDLIGNIPRDMIVMNWTYGASESFEARIKPFKEAGLDQFVCPGVQNWNQIFPNEEVAVVNIPNFVRDGQRANALGMMNTSWDDDGESLFEMTWYGIVLGAAASWQSAPLDVSGFDRDFDWAFFRSDGQTFTHVIRDLGRVATIFGAGPTDPLFWQEPFTAAFQARARTLNEKARQVRLLVEADEETLLREGDRARRNRSMIPAML
ncbi:MAG: beta-N-acetylhexosaminidase, partial [Acidobacteriota bacterium]|nr:beta-N-acetylhexosaminidase [Acidobacteriota bacterium]